ncbi:molecular chaperone DnaJ [Gilvimarinus sp. DA14]|uniref:molecular chaperone DnaJ n=1 Tax=Gilvimarinus sp. DA14 TaxID=2956798 RepID=UPI0020B88218|nr:molecular chaperone DnaJ [Gilvimarinus sp. DA14]UTF60529.1 molecular chaperone DnaJ [Gilvimarinus sp. DA14]
MFRLIPILLILGLIFLGYSWLKKQPTAQKRKAIMQLLAALLVLLLVVLAVTGRIHWLGAALGALLALAKPLLGLLPQILPFLRRKSPPSRSAKMDTAEAAEVLGLQRELQARQLNRDMVISAHKRLMQKVHPDRGGNDYLASRINEAKTVLLQSIPS